MVRNTQSLISRNWHLTQGGFQGFLQWNSGYFNSITKFFGGWEEGEVGGYSSIEHSGWCCKQFKCFVAWLYIIYVIYEIDTIEIKLHTVCTNYIQLNFTILKLDTISNLLCSFQHQWAWLRQCTVLYAVW